MARSEKPQMILAELAETTTRTGHQIFAGNANGLRVLLVYHRERTNAGTISIPPGTYTRARNRSNGSPIVAGAAHPSNHVQVRIR